MGTTVSDKFQLKSGQYKVNATLDVTTGVSGFIVMTYDPSGTENLTFNQLIQAAGMWTGSAVFKAGQDGEYYVSVQNTTDAWTLEFELY